MISDGGPWSARVAARSLGIETVTVETMRDGMGGPWLICSRSLAYLFYRKCHLVALALQVRPNPAQNLRRN